MRAGAGWRDITPGEPIPLGGQMHVRLGEWTRDPLTVNLPSSGFQEFFARKRVGIQKPEERNISGL